jgi:hypothetical protein
LPAILLAILLIHNKLDGSNIIIIKGRNWRKWIKLY